MPKKRRVTRLSANLRYLRLKQAFTQEFVGDMIGCTRSAMCKYESGDRAPSAEQLRKLGYLYKTTVDDLLNEDLSGIFTKESSDETL